MLHTRHQTSRLLTAAQVIDRYFTGPDGRPLVHVRWVLKHVPRVKLSRKTVLFTDAEVQAYLNRCSAVAA